MLRIVDTSNMNYESVMKLALERAFYFPSCEVYGDAQAGFWEYGPTGVSAVSYTHLTLPTKA